MIIVVLLIVLLLFGGGWGVRTWNSPEPAWGGPGVVGLLIIILLVLYLTGHRF